MTTDANARRQQNFALYERLLRAQNGLDRAGFLDCVADDMVFRAPAYVAGGAPIAESREAMGRVFDRMAEMFSSMNYRVKRFIPAVDPDLVLAEVAGDSIVAANGNAYRNDYLFIAECRDGRIADLLEYSSPRVFAEAVDGPARDSVAAS